MSSSSASINPHSRESGNALSPVASDHTDTTPSMGDSACSRQLITSACPFVTGLRYEQPMLHIGGF